MIDGGNPAGVVLGPGRLTEEQMKRVTKILSVSETAFVFPSKIADYKLRFFSPLIEVDLCGHATIATFFTLAQENMFEPEMLARSTIERSKGGSEFIRIIYNALGEKEEVISPGVEYSPFKNPNIHSTPEKSKKNVQQIINDLNQSQVQLEKNIDIVLDSETPNNQLQLLLENKGLLDLNDEDLEMFPDKAIREIKGTQKAADKIAHDKMIRDQKINTLEVELTEKENELEEYKIC